MSATTEETGGPAALRALAERWTDPDVRVRDLVDAMLGAASAWERAERERDEWEQRARFVPRIAEAATSSRATSGPAAWLALADKLDADYDHPEWYPTVREAVAALRDAGRLLTSADLATAYWRERCERAERVRDAVREYDYLRRECVNAQECDAGWARVLAALDGSALATRARASDDAARGACCHRLFAACVRDGCMAERGLIAAPFVPRGSHEKDGHNDPGEWLDAALAAPAARAGDDAAREACRACGGRGSVTNIPSGTLVRCSVCQGTALAAPAAGEVRDA